MDDPASNPVGVSVGTIKQRARQVSAAVDSGDVAQEINVDPGPSSELIHLKLQLTRFADFF